MLDLNSVTPFQPPKNPLDDFDPNVAQKPWATYCPGRSPAFKIHSQLGHATSAVMNKGRHYGAILYKQQDGKWVEIARMQPNGFKPPRCEVCSQNLMRDEERYDYRAHQRVKTGRIVNSGMQTFERQRGRLVKPPRVLTLCDGCYSVNAR